MLGGFGRDRDGQCNSCVAVVHINGLRYCRDLAHIPKDLPKQRDALCIQRENVHAVLRACRFGCKYGYDLTPVWSLPDNLDGRKIPVLQAFQLGMIFALNFCNGGCQRNGIVAFLLVRKEDAERRSQKCACDNDDGKHNKKRRAAAQTGECAYQLLDGLCRGFGQLFRGCGGCSGRAVVALFKHLSLCVLCGCFPCAFCRGFRCRRF